jgi:hypothetical protein
MRSVHHPGLGVGHELEVHGVHLVDLHHLHMPQSKIKSLSSSPVHPTVRSWAGKQHEAASSLICLHKCGRESKTQAQRG